MDKRIKAFNEFIINDNKHDFFCDALVNFLQKDIANKDFFNICNSIVKIQVYLQDNCVPLDEIPITLLSDVAKNIDVFITNFKSIDLVCLLNMARVYYLYATINDEINLAKDFMKCDKNILLFTMWNDFTNKITPYINN